MPIIEQPSQKDKIAMGTSTEFALQMEADACVNSDTKHLTHFPPPSGGVLQAENKILQVKCRITLLRLKKKP